MRHMTVGSSYVDEREARLIPRALAKTIPLGERALRFDFQSRRFRQVAAAENKGTVVRHSVRTAKALAFRPAKDVALLRGEPRTAL